jgi:hypothetical protein
LDGANDTSQMTMSASHDKRKLGIAQRRRILKRQRAVKVRLAGGSELEPASLTVYKDYEAQ